MSQVHTFKIELEGHQTQLKQKHNEFYTSQPYQKAIEWLKTQTHQKEWKVHEKREESRQKAKNSEPIVVINDLNNSEHDILTMVEQVLTKNEFSDDSSIFVVVPSIDNDADSSDHRNSSVCMQMSGNPVTWKKKDNLVERDPRQHRNSYAHHGMKLSSIGKNNFVEDLPTGMLLNHNAEAQFNRKSSMPKDNWKKATKNKLCQIAIPNEIVQRARSRSNVVSMDTTVDRPCCCSVKTNDDNSNDRYVGKVMSNLVTPFLVKPGMFSTPFYKELGVKQQQSERSATRTSQISPCNMPPCRPHDAKQHTTAPFQEHIRAPIQQLTCVPSRQLSWAHDRRTEACPTSHCTEACPNQHRSEAYPNQHRAKAYPTQHLGEAGSTQHHAEDNPNQNRAEACPNQHLAEACPNQHRAKAYPTQHLGEAGSTQHHAEDNPNQNRAEACPNQHRTEACPNQHRSEACPNQHRSEACPNQHRAKAYPTQHLGEAGSAQHPNQHRSEACPNQHRTEACPNQHRTEACPNQHRSEACPNQHRSEACPNQHRAKAYPTQHLGEAGSTQHHAEDNPKKNLETCPDQHLAEDCPMCQCSPDLMLKLLKLAVTGGNLHDKDWMICEPCPEPPDTQVPGPTKPSAETSAEPSAKPPDTIQQFPNCMKPKLTGSSCPCEVYPPRRMQIEMGETKQKQGSVKQTRFMSTVGTSTDPKLSRKNAWWKRRKNVCECPPAEPEPEPIKEPEPNPEWKPEMDPEPYLTLESYFSQKDSNILSPEVMKKNSLETERVSGFRLVQEKKEPPEPGSDYTVEDAIRYLAMMNPDTFQSIVAEHQAKRDGTYIPPPPPPAVEAPPSTPPPGEGSFKGLKFKIGGKGSGSKGLAGVCCFDLLTESFTPW